jgi:hypothetical protein
VKRSLRRLGTAAAVLVVGLAGLAAPAAADSGTATYTSTLLAKAQPDECFNGIGQPYPVGPPCAEGQSKVNQAYVWGLTKIGNDVWFGTGANVNCLVSGATLNVQTPVVNSDYVCEYDQSQTVRDDPTWPGDIGDQRPPEVWLYNAATKKDVNMSSQITGRSADDAQRLKDTIGLRAAGNLNGVVFLGGPALNNALNLFAFDAHTHKFIGSTTMTEYGNIRTFLVAENALYLGVGIGDNGSAGGGVLRWTGTRQNPFVFEIVASLGVQAADLTYYDGRIAATSWPASQPTSTLQLAGVWISPKLSDGEPGLNPEDSGAWTQAWNARQYEPDKVIAVTYGGGGIASYDGYLYWGTMHVPMKATKVEQNLYPQTTQEAQQTQVINTQRAISIWRGKDLGTPDAKVELVYGETALPAYNPVTASWSTVSTGWTPLYGKSGFGMPYNNYTWRMTVVDNKLFVGTMDWSYIVHDIANQASASGQSELSTEMKQMSDPSTAGAKAIDPTLYGGDLWMFSSNTAPATAISTDGLGNYLNYGIRNMVPDGSGLYIGMANPMNLRTDTTGTTPQGGWELIKLTKSCTK